MPKRRVAISILTVIVTVLCCGLAPLRADEDSAAEARRQAELFTHQYDSVLKQIQKIPGDAKQLDEALKKDRDPADIKEFRKALSDALSVLADNGALETFTKDYIQFLEERLKTDQEDTHYSETQKKIAVDGWSKKLAQAKDVINNLNAERKNVIRMLTYAQTEEDFLMDIMAIKNQDEIIDMLQDFSNGLHRLSDELESIQSKLPNM